MFKHYAITFILFLVFANAFAQNKFTLSGELRDSSNGETLIGALVKVVETSKAVSTNTYGYFALNLPAGKYTIAISYLGFQSRTIKINLNKNASLNLKLSQKINVGKEVVIR